MKVRLQVVTVTFPVTILTVPSTSEQEDHHGCRIVSLLWYEFCPGRFLSHINLGVGAIYFQKRQPYMYATLLLKQEGGERYDRP